MNRCGDGCFTGIAVGVLIVRGGWILGKHSLEEGCLSVKTGWHETTKTVRHLVGATSRFLHCIGSIAFAILKELGSLFPVLYNESVKSFYALGQSLYTAKEFVSFFASPLAEIFGLMRSGVRETLHPLIHLWHASQVAGHLFRTIAGPYVGESLSALTTSAESTLSTGYALYGGLRSGFGMGKAALGGVASESLSLPLQALTVFPKTARASKRALSSYLSVSREGTLRLIIEALYLFKTGYSESIKTFQSLPPALKALLALPFEGVLSLFKEIIDVVKAGKVETIKAFSSAKEACGVLEALLNATLVSFLENLEELGGQGWQETKKTGYALLQAADHGTEEMRKVLFAFLIENLATFMQGLQSSQKAAVGFKQAIQSGDVVFQPASALAKESFHLLPQGFSATIKSAISAWHVAGAVSAPFKEWFFGTVNELALVLSATPASCLKTGCSTISLISTGHHLFAEGPYRIFHETFRMSFTGWDQTKKFNFQSTHNVAEGLKVHFIYPMDEWFTPKMDAIQAFFAYLDAKVSAKIASWFQ